MQFLTNAALLPYLFTRDRGGAMKGQTVYKEDLSSVEAVGESKIIPGLFGSVGLLSIAWICLGRAGADAGFATLDARWASFVDMMTHDRLGFSFVVDLTYFALFQGWLISDDLARRNAAATSGPSGTMTNLEKIGAYVPFFGLVYYLLQRPPLPQKNE
jgi:hypothetical protein